MVFWGGGRMPAAHPWALEHVNSLIPFHPDTCIIGPQFLHAFLSVSGIMDDSSNLGFGQTKRRWLTHTHNIYCLDEGWSRWRLLGVYLRAFLSVSLGLLECISRGPGSVFKRPCDGSWFNHSRKLAHVVPFFRREVKNTC